MLIATASHALRSAIEGSIGLPRLIVAWSALYTLLGRRARISASRAWASAGCKSAGIGCIECKQPVIDAILREQQPWRERAEAYLACGVDALFIEALRTPEQMALACERFGLAPSEVLFFDDSEWNVRAAAAFGFDVHHFTDPAALRPALEARGLL